MITQGSVDNPVALDPWQYIIDVHWNTGGVGILTLDRSELCGFNMIVASGSWGYTTDDLSNGFPYGVEPPSANPGDTLKPKDYKDFAVIHCNLDKSTGKYLWENGISPITVDYAQVYVYGTDSLGHDAYVVAGTDHTGYGPSYDIRSKCAVFKKVIDVSPNGHRVEYYDGSIDYKTSWWIYADYYGKKSPMTVGNPSGTWWNVDDMDPTQQAMIDWTVGYPTALPDAELIWTKTHHVPPKYLNLTKSVWIINFGYKSDDNPMFPPLRIDSQIVSQVPQPPPVNYTLQIYDKPHNLTINSDGTVTAKDDDVVVLPKITQTGSGRGKTVEFNSSGVTRTISYT